MELKLNATVGTMLLRYVSAANEFPEALGQQKFSATMRAKFREGMRQLRKTLKEHSPILKDEDLMYFGPRSWYDAVKATPDEIAKGADEVRYKFKKREAGKPAAELAVKVVGKALEMGLPAIFLLWSHSDSKMRLPVGDMDDLAWPLIAQAKLTRWVEQNTGLLDGETFEVKYDADEVMPPTPAVEADVEAT